MIKMKRQPIRYPDNFRIVGPTFQINFIEKYAPIKTNIKIINEFVSL